MIGAHFTGSNPPKSRHYHYIDAIPSRLFGSTIQDSKKPGGSNHESRKTKILAQLPLSYSSRELCDSRALVTGSSDILEYLASTHCAVVPHLSRGSRQRGLELLYRYQIFYCLPALSTCYRSALDNKGPRKSSSIRHYGPDFEYLD